MLKIIFIGDISGKLGREAIKKIVPKLKKQSKADLIIANGENMAHGVGVTKSTLEEILEAGVDYITTGDHSFDANAIEDIYNGQFPIIRPANFPPSNPGSGFILIEKNKKKILLVNLIGRVFMRSDYDCPFREIDKILAMFTKKNLSAIIVDIHAEATSEKIAFKHYLDGRVSAVLGTHTHVMTADSQITDRKTAFISDVGMTGSADGIIGVDKENILKNFLDQRKYKHTISKKGRAIFNAVEITINEKNKKAIKIKPIIKFIDIK